VKVAPGRVASRPASIILTHGHFDHAGSALELAREWDVPVYFTTDWGAARRSIELLASLDPSAVGAGHGIPMTGARVAEEFRAFAEGFRPPRKGRYVREPVRADERGVVALPPPVPDPLPKVLAGVGLALAAGGLVAAAARRGGVDSERRTRKGRSTAASTGDARRPATGRRRA
jgi:hypothetical protein